MIKVTGEMWDTPHIVDVDCILNVTKFIHEDVAMGTAIQLTSGNAVSGATIKGGLFKKEHKVDFNIITTGATIYVKETIEEIQAMLLNAGVEIYASERVQKVHPDNIPVACDVPESEGSQPEWPPEEGEY
jgi:hypothetical protein